MSKPNDDPNTKGKGASILDKIKNLINGDDADAGQSGSDTSADDTTDLEGNDKTTDDDSADDTSSDDTSDDDKTDADKKAKEKTFKQDELDKIVTTRLQKQKNTMTGDFKKEKETLEGTITALQTELATYRKVETDAVKAEFDSLPEEVRELYTVDFEKPEEVAKFKESLPKVKALAAKLTPASTEEEKRKRKRKRRKTATVTTSRRSPRPERRKKPKRNW